ncbi:hypothetical protein ACVWXO_001116 [Bradyrhizobium sp. LM2.7]
MPGGPLAYCAAQAARQRAAVKSFLITDADYVEVLTEIGIQTPVPDLIKERRNGRSFLFFGCRFNDRLLLFMRGRSPNARLTSITRSSIRKHSRARNSAFWSSNT